MTPDRTPEPGRFRLMGQAAAVYFRSAPFASGIQLVVTVVPGLAPAATAWLTGRLLDRLAESDRPGVAAYALALALLGALTAFAVHVERYASTEISRRVSLATQAELFTALGRRPGLREIEEPGFQDRLRLAQQASQSGPRQLVTAALGIEQATLTVVGFVAVLTAVSPFIAVFVLTSTVPMVWGQFALGRRRTAMLQRTAPRLRRQLFYALLLTDLRAAKEIRVFGTGGFLRTRMLGELRAAQDGERRVDRATLRFDGTFSLFTAVVSGAVLVTAALRIDGGAGGIGGMTVLIMALASLQAALAGIAEQVAGANQAVAMFGNYAALVGDRTEADEAPCVEVPTPFSGVELRDVWFRYHPDHPWILKGVSLRIAPGQSVALVGLNGAGKSTLTKLICGLYEPTRGAVTWNGVDIRRFDPAALRSRISAVFQDFMCYEMPAAENIAIGDVGALRDEPRLRAAAVGAGVDQVLAALPDGYRTMLSRIFVLEQSSGSAEPERGPGPNRLRALGRSRLRRRRRRRPGGRDGRPAAAVREAAREVVGEAGPATGREAGAVGAGIGAGAAGVALSGGQWQRVALARALVRSEADLLILDEPTSGLDARAESEITASLRIHRAGRSSLLISHRLNAVRDAEHIVVLDQGRIIEEGTHETLMAGDGAYAELFRVQAAGYQLPAEATAARSST